MNLPISWTISCFFFSCDKIQLLQLHSNGLFLCVNITFCVLLYISDTLCVHYVLCVGYLYLGSPFLGLFLCLLGGLIASTVIVAYCCGAMPTPHTHTDPAELILALRNERERMASPVNNEEQMHYPNK